MPYLRACRQFKAKPDFDLRLRLKKCHPLTQHIDAAYLLNENGDIAYDLVGPLHLDERALGAWEADHNGLKLNFDGTNYAVSGDSNSGGYTFGFPHTLVVFGEFGNTLATQKVFASITTKQSIYDRYVALYSDYGRIRYSIYVGPQSFIITDNGSGYSTNTEYCIAGVSRASNDHELYINGVSQGTSTTNITSNISNLDTVGLGCAYKVGTGAYKNHVGKLRLVLYWSNRALTQDELIELQSDPFQIIEPIHEYAFFSVSGGIPISKVFQIHHESNAGLNALHVTAMETTKSLAKTMVIPIEASGYIAGAHQVKMEWLSSLQLANQFLLESLTGLQAQSTHPLESAGSITKTAVLFMEGRQSLSAQTNHVIESLVSLAKSFSMNLEQLQIVAIVNSHHIEALGSAALSSISQVEMESMGYLQAGHSPGIESLQPAQASHVSLIESLAGIQKQISMKIESIGMVSVSSQAQIEVIAHVSGIHSMEIEHLSSISGTSILSNEALQSISSVTGIPIESLLGTGVNVIVNVVKKTALFTLALDRDAVFSKTLNKEVTFH